VLLIREESEQARVLVAIVVSTAFLAIRLSVKPLRRTEDGALFALIDLALILIYLCVLLIKSCDMSSVGVGVLRDLEVDQLGKAVCDTYGFGDSPSGVYLFFVFFGLGMLFLQLLIMASNLWVAGYVPKILLVAQSHSVPPSQVIRKVLSRRLRRLKHSVSRALRLDRPHLTPRTAALIFKFRTVAMVSPVVPPEDMPKEVAPVFTGNLAELAIARVFPRASCFIQCDRDVLAIRWTARHFVSLSAIREVKAIAGTRRGSMSRSFRKRSVDLTSLANDSSALPGVDALSRQAIDLACSQEQEASCSAPNTVPDEPPAMPGAPVVNVTYDDSGAVPRRLEIYMTESKAKAFARGLKKLLKIIPPIASSAHWRWAFSCMAATSERGATGSLMKAEFRALLRRANASTALAPTALVDFLQAASESEERLALPQWLSTATASGPHQADVFNARQVTWFLLHVCTSSPHVAEVFARYARDNELGKDDWRSFIHAEQLSQDGKEQTTIDQAMLDYDALGRPMRLLDFALRLLSVENNAIAPAREPDKVEHLQQPLAQYWIACSHNSYIVGDQLTGLSDADMYRRLLLQGERHLEIDCWDGPKTKPIVTHGHTFCTVESFENVAKAITGSAFLTSRLPVILSLEMHCSQPQQNTLAKTAVEQLGSLLLPYEELVQLGQGQATSLSPLELERRVMLKGKVRLRGKSFKQNSFWEQKTAAVVDVIVRTTTAVRDRSQMCSSTRRCSQRSGPGIRPAGDDMGIDPGSIEIENSRESRCSSRDSERGDDYDELSAFTSSEAQAMQESGDAAEGSAAGSVAQAYKKRSKTSKNKQSYTEPFYSAQVCMRSLPVKSFLAENLHGWALPISSVNEDNMLTAMGLTSAERNAIEGLRNAARTVDGTVETEEEQSARAVALLAVNPPPQVGKLQKLTAKWLLRPYPLGLRFSGKNMNPLPFWLSGAQNVCLNMSNLDLYVTMHYALFNGSEGFVLKPPEMVLQATVPATILSQSPSTQQKASRDLGVADHYWPPARDVLHLITIKVLSLHMCPKRGEHRPLYNGRRGACHKFIPVLSGPLHPPNGLDAINTSLKLSLHPIGGFCAVSSTLPLPQQNVKAEITLPANESGTDPALGHDVHCMAAEPHETFVRISVTDDRTQEVAFETAVLGRLRAGYRVFRMRSTFGTRIELCYLLVHIAFESELHLWLSPRQLRIQSRKQHANMTETVVRAARRHAEQVARLEEEINTLRRQTTVDDEHMVVSEPL